MTDYCFPKKDVEFILRHLLTYDELAESVQIDGVDASFLMEILGQAQRFGRDVLAPLYRSGDLQPAKLINAGVSETPGHREAYQQYIEGGWMSLPFEADYGGQNLLNLLAVAVNEIVHTTAGVSFGLCPLLSQGAIHAINAHGSDALKEKWLPKMISGEWTGTMNLTEPGAGSDLAAIQTRAVQHGDHYKITGQKIFITWGDHQMTENIVHLVLARLPGAPQGVKGISLFLVPKFLVDESGNMIGRNDACCISVEHKLGIHASPTCTMVFGENDGAVGYLVGEPHNGLAAMFTMMNQARQGVGLQGLSVSQASYQQALEYAGERLQGTRADGSRFPIFDFPDVRRMLMQMKASIEAMRALVYLAGFEEDLQKQAVDQNQKEHHQARSALLTPIVKAWCTELAQEVTYLSVQIHGGMGFIEETGAAQHYRDARVLTIYEGTTGIQALDFVGRKILRDNGRTLNQLLDEIEEYLPELVRHSETAPLAEKLSRALASCRDISAWILDQDAEDVGRAQFASVSILMAFGYLTGGWLMARSAVKAITHLNVPGADNAFLKAKLATAEFYMSHLLSRIDGLALGITEERGEAFKLSYDQFQCG